MDRRQRDVNVTDATMESVMQMAIEEGTLMAQNASELRGESYGARVMIRTVTKGASARKEATGRALERYLKGRQQAGNDKHGKEVIAKCEVYETDEQI